VQLWLENPLSALLDPGFLEAAVRRHFEPLLDARFGEILSSHYPQGIQIIINGRWLSGSMSAPGWAPVSIRFGRKRKPSASRRHPPGFVTAFLARWGEAAERPRHRARRAGKRAGG
jgi:hypothetical protein